MEDGRLHSGEQAPGSFQVRRDARRAPPTCRPKAVGASTTQLDFHLGRTQVHVVLPPVDKLAFYAGLAGAAAFGAIEWPIALLTGVGHLLSDDRRNRTLGALGEALDAAVQGSISPSLIYWPIH